MTNDSTRKLQIFALIAILAFGIYMRVDPSTLMTHLGFDENYYRLYLMMLHPKGLASYPMIAKSYVGAQADMALAVIPPMRVTYIATAYVCQLVFHSGPLIALRNAACFYSILSLFVTAIFVWRMSGLPATLGVTALMSCAPLQIQMAQRVYIDGVFAFFALLTLWLLWENLCRPNHWPWLTAYFVSLALMVMTKENAAFAYLGLVGILLLNKWVRFGITTPRLLCVTVLGPAAGVVGLIIAAGGLTTLIAVFKLNVVKSSTMEYAIKTGDGPWFRYLLDLLTMSPAVTLLAIAGYFALSRLDKPKIYFAVFIAVSYLIMANLKYGLNLRYTAMWDMPLRWLAFAQLTTLAALLPRKFVPIFLSLSVLVLCLTDLQSYFLFFVQNGVYDPVPDPLLRLLNILK